MNHLESRPKRLENARKCLKMHEKVMKIRENSSNISPKGLEKQGEATGDGAGCEARASP